MALFIVLYHKPGNTCFMFGEINEDRHMLAGCVVEFEGTLVEAQTHFAKQAFYGGDSTADPEDYRPKFEGFEPHDPVTVVVAPYEESMRMPLDTILAEHNSIHRKIEEAETEIAEKKELARLQEKYS